MNNKVGFNEDMRKYKKTVVIFTVVFYLLSVLLVTFGLLIIALHLEERISFGTREVVMVFILGIVFLFGAIFCNVFMIHKKTRKYFFYSLIIKDEKIKLTLEFGKFEYDFSQLTSYSVVSDKAKFGTYLLKFSDDKSYEVTSAKQFGLKQVLDEILKTSSK